MRTAALALLVSFVVYAATAPVEEDVDARSLSRDKDATNQPRRSQAEKANNGGTKDSTRHPKESREGSKDKASKDKASKKSRKHKAIFLNYPVASQLPFSDISYDYSDSGNANTEGRNANRYQESNIFYIRLPPTPYMYVPGLGYISQPPRYSTASLRPQIPYAKPGRPKPAHQQPVNPFIKLPIDFVSNGKPTSVYQWQKKNKKPTDSPITNLDTLSSEFVSNGKPTSVYQWQDNRPGQARPTKKPIKKPNKQSSDDLPNNLDKGPYTFNGKPTSFFLLRPDGTSTAHQPLRYPDYQLDNSYY